MVWVSRPGSERWAVLSEERLQPINLPGPPSPRVISLSYDAVLGLQLAPGTTSPFQGLTAQEKGGILTD